MSFPRPITDQNSDLETLTAQSKLQIESLVFEGRLKPGERISEAQLTGLLGFGLAPIRNALDLLASEGLLVRIPRSGTFVRELNFKEYSDILDVRLSLETLAIRLVRQHATPEEKADLIRAAKKVDQTEQRFVSGKIRKTEMAKADVAFHLKLASLSKNFQLLHLLRSQRLLEQCFLAGLQLSIGLRTRIQDKAIRHVAIAEATTSGSEAEAIKLMDKHVLQARKSVMTLMMGPAL
ncbi:MAG: GntR family transcriptional regulator [Opitutaceae bacterium]|nr:GntR family transcriptional regulator [Opitutaceae bacterium]